MVNMLAKNWWMLIARGVFAVIFGVIALIVPQITLAALILMFGAYVLVDGVFNSYTAFTARQMNPRWWVTLLEGLVGILAGILTFIFPTMTAIVLLYVIAFWAIMTGILEIAAAIQLRQEISNEWLLGLGGVLSMMFGIALILAPGTGALALVWVIGLYAITFGVSLIILGFRVRAMPTTPTNNRESAYTTG